MNTGLHSKPLYYSEETRDDSKRFCLVSTWIKSWPLILVIALTIHLPCLAIIFYQNMENTRINAQYQTTLQRKMTAKVDVQNSVEKWQLYKRYQAQFDQYRINQVIGNATPARVIEALYSVSQRWPNLTIEMAPSTTHATDATAGRHMQLYVTKQTFQGGLLHEGDLYTLLSSLRKTQVPFRVKTCELEKRPAIIFSAQAKNIDLYCEIDWFHLDIHSAEKGVG